MEDPNKDRLIKLSASSVKTYTQCPRKYRYTYIDRIQRKEWEHLDLGNFCHKTLEIFHREYKDNKDGVKSLNSLMTNSFNTARKDFELTEEVLRDAQSLLREYLAKVSKAKMPNVQGIEIPFEFELDKDLIIRGFIDRLDLVKDRYKIVDYKTTKNTKYLEPFQLNIYGLWLIKEHPEVKTFDGSYILLRHKSTTKDYTINMADLNKTKRDLIGYADRINQEQDWKTAPSILCRWCDFNDICDFRKQKDW